MKYAGRIFQVGLLLLWILFSVGISDGKSKSDFLKGIMFSPGDERMHWCEDCDTSSGGWDFRRDSLIDSRGGLQDAFADMDSLNINWYYQCYLTKQDIQELDRPDLFFSTIALPGHMEQWLEASRCNMDVGWELERHSQSYSIELGTRTLWPGASNTVASTVPDPDVPNDPNIMIMETIAGTDSPGWIIQPGSWEAQNTSQLEDPNVRLFSRNDGTSSTHHRWAGGNFDRWYRRAGGRTGFSFIPYCKIPAEAQSGDTVAAIVVCMATHTGHATVPDSLDMRTPEQVGLHPEGWRESPRSVSLGGLEKGVQDVRSATQVFG